MYKKIALIAVALALSGCVTPYQEMGSLGGVSATQISNDTFQISALGSANTKPDAIERYALRKAAETTLSNGFDYFIVADTQDRSESGSYSLSGVQVGRKRAVGYSFGGNFLKPGQSIMIKCLKGPQPSPLPPGMFDARDVQKFLSTGSFVPPGPTS